MQVFFLSDTENAEVETLAEGHRIPRFLSLPEGQTGFRYVPTLGLVAVLRFGGLTPMEARVCKTGRWTLGVMPAGRHATLLHMEMKLEGVRAIAPDFTFSAEHHRQISGENAADGIGAGTMLTLVVAAAETGKVRVLRRTMLSDFVGGALASDLTRQAAHASEFTFEAHSRETTATLRAFPQVTRAHCAAWEVVHDLPSASTMAKG